MSRHQSNFGRMMCVYSAEEPVMSIEGHWTIRFASVAGEKVQRESGGVVTLRAGQVLGGDTWAYYSGKYELAGQRLALRVDVAIHFFAGGESILGGPLVPYTLVG